MQHFLQPESTNSKSRLVVADLQEHFQQEPYGSEWFNDFYGYYEVNKETEKKLKPLLEEVQIKAFMGTWCEDSQREVPNFYKIADFLKLNTNSIELVTLDKEKEKPDHLEDGFNITNVPTFIFSKDGKEINRIVEFPVTSLEKDMLSILSGQAYKHSYAE